ncbi:CPBP family intramembrane glutamic endopeptidase [Sphingomonas sp. 8AM]|uniref:CPBP family intramembrane glutamic endopeptidase n=1 Tax=Sphingomonas sp. 8AM TaxID=2653170 RepID=UPI0012F2DFDA|nr:type II CAAX endopeptidase family protein [Sphingomonas sp. 8AM]VXD01237.1 CPBP family intramembrane metalloprotease domain-containing protein [Sphingomonas sp. 8AM]
MTPAADRDDDMPRWPAAAIACFLLLTILFGAPFAIFARAAPQDPLTALIGAAFMWTPGLAALVTCRVFGRRIAALPWRWPAARYAWLGYAIPVAYLLAAYPVLWATGLAPASIAAFDAGARAALGLGEGTATLVAVVLVATVGVVRAAANALGEEIGWRGLLVPALADRLSFAGVAFVNGVIWFAWHIPSILLTDYNAGAPVAVTLACFGVGTIAMGGIAAWLSLRSRSLWPAVLLHASHNAWTELLFDRMTVVNARSAWWATEFGIGLNATTVVALLLLCWLGGVPATRADRR